jgi:hypothetical protein
MFVVSIIAVGSMGLGTAAAELPHVNFCAVRHHIVVVIVIVFMLCHR